MPYHHPQKHLNDQKPTIGITLGDPGGIGPEITAKALADDTIRTLAHFVLIGDKTVYDHYGKHSMEGIAFHDHHLISQFHSADAIPIPERGKAAYSYLETAISCLKNQTINGVVTAPVNKRAIIQAGVTEFSGHTEMFANAFNVKDVEMMFVGGPYKTIIATRHIPLHQVASALTSEQLIETISLADHCLRETFKIPKPHIAVCGINPHAGEGGSLGTEELTTVIPAIEKAQQKGIDARGPFAADTLFISFNAQQYDLIIAMYHDQGLAPIKALYFKQLINFTIGLPFIRTSTAHGTAENIVGQNKADPSSMMGSIKLACKLTANQKI